MLEPYTVTATWDELPDALLVRSTESPTASLVTGPTIVGVVSAAANGGRAWPVPSKRSIEDQLGRLRLSKDDIAFATVARG